MQTFKVIKKEGHLLLSEMDRLWVLDTGAPNSFGDHDELSIEGLSHIIPNNYLGLDAEQLSQNLKFKITGLIGGDILNNYNTAWDCKECEITFMDEDNYPNGISIPIELFMGIPTLTVEVNNSKQKWFFDTGANICYVTEKPENWTTPVDTHDDFYPGFGNFQTEVHETQVQFHDTPKQVKCGVLPELLGLSLSLGGCTGILGINEFLDSSFYYSPRTGKIITDG